MIERPNKIPGNHSVAGTILVVLLCAGCGEQVETDRQERTPTDHAATVAADGPVATLAGAHSSGDPIVVTHGGVGSPPDWSRYCRQAARTGAATSRGNPSALTMATTAVVVMENQPLFNAGTGANIRLDGQTIQMDAAVMTSTGDFAAVAALERVRNPILVALAVLDTPHRLLVGEGATRFAHRMGFEDVVPTCPEAEAKNQQRIQRLLDGKAGGGYDDFDWRTAWNYPTPAPGSAPAEPLEGQQGPAGEAGETGDTEDSYDGNHDTVGAVARAADGTFAAALSTGGTSITLYGRVGDVPIYACGCYAGPAGAVACTGFGEEIIRHAMARSVYDLLESGLDAREAVRVSCQRFPEEYSLGLIAVAAESWGVAANREMAWGRESFASD